MLELALVHVLRYVEILLRRELRLVMTEILFQVTDARVLASKKLAGCA